MSDAEGLSYASAGVDIKEGDRLVDNVRELAKATHGPGVLDGLGGFAALFSLKDFLAVAGAMDDPVLVSGTDGVGTKLKVAFQANQHRSIGQDLVAMCINDLLTTGARPMFFLDYFGTGKLSADVATQVVAGIAEACSLAQCALVGGETAELPGMYAAGEYDLAGFAVGVVDRAKIVDGQSAKPGHVLLGVHARGLHSNGYSLARAALLERAALKLEAQLDGCALPLGGELLRPTAIYTAMVMALVAAVDVKAMAHITGGGLPGNLPRVLPDGTVAVVDKSTWQRPSLFGHIQTHGNVAEDEMYRTFNMGVGLVVVVAPEEQAAAIAAIENAGETVSVIGQLEATGDSEKASLRWAT